MRAYKMTYFKISLIAVSLMGLSGCKANSVHSIPISSGQELRVDLDQDGTPDRVYVKDIRNDENGYTRVTGLLSSDGMEHSIDFEGYFSSALTCGDLSGNGKADILVSKYDTGSTFGSVDVSILHFDNGEWKTYPTVLIPNTDINLFQPLYFGGEYYWEEGYSPCIEAGIIADKNRTFLRLIMLFPDTMDQETVECIDASWTEDGWQIDDARVIENYYEQIDTLLPGGDL